MYPGKIYFVDSPSKMINIKQIMTSGMSMLPSGPGHRIDEEDSNDYDEDD